jgi:hypothetical protein
VLVLRGVFLGSTLLALSLTVLIVGVACMTGIAVRRLRSRTTTLAAGRHFAEAVAAGDFDRAELQVGLLLKPLRGPAARCWSSRPCRKGAAGRIDPAASAAFEPAVP